ncbi:MAG: nucleotidyltransferase family protein [Acidobacteria bacterium]|nr:nucleotidyltransferase family protein [Acidobacteriota bacterium]
MPSRFNVVDLFGLSAERRLQFNPSKRPELLQALTPETLTQLERLDLLPLCAYLLRRHASWNDLEENVTKPLERELAGERARSLRLAAGLEPVLAALARAEIPVILLKGVDLGFHTYPARGLRRMLDLDILVPLRRLKDASSVLLEIGFREDTSCYSRDWYLGCVQQLPPLEDETGFIHLDVHGALFPAYSPFAPLERGVWSTTLPSAWPQARRLTREWMVWHLVLHALKHLKASGVRERLHVDLLALVANTEKEPIDWSRLVELAENTGTAFALSEAVGRLSRAPGAGALVPVAAELAELARAQWSRELVFRVTHRLRHVAPFVGRDIPAPPDAWLQFFRRPLRTLKALRGK